MSQNDEKERGGWVGRRGETKGVERRFRFRLSGGSRRCGGEAREGRAFANGPSATGVEQWREPGRERRSEEDAKLIRVELKVAGDVVEQAPSTASGQRIVLKRLKAEWRRSTCNSSRPALRLTLFGWVAL